VLVFQVGNAKFGSLQELVEDLGVSIQDTFSKKNASYTHSDFVQEAIQTMGDLVRDSTFQLLAVPWDTPGPAPPLSAQHGPLALIADDCQDTAVQEQMAIVLRTVVNGQVVERFVGLVHLPNQKAETIQKALMDWCVQRRIDTNRILVLGSDGASTWTGSKTGVFVRWLKEHPLAFHIWCCCHKMALVAKAAAADKSSPAEHPAAMEAEG